MLLSPNKLLRQIVGVLETGIILFLRLLLKDRAAAAVYPGEVYRAYMAHAREGAWRHAAHSSRSCRVASACAQ